MVKEIPTNQPYILSMNGVWKNHY